MFEGAWKIQDLAAEGLPDRSAELAQLFPEAMTDGKVDIDKLRLLLGDTVEDSPERYGLNWPGKREAIRLSQKQSTATLKPMPGESVDFDTTKNVIIEGDNLEVLKLMQKSYYGKVKLIYIDPPYNTGNDFVYSDDFAQPMTEYLRVSGQADDNGHRTSANKETSGRFHSDWLNMMYPRLVVARNFLAEDGVLFASIDDNEAPRFQALLEEVFGQENFVAKMVWAAGRKNDSRLISESHEYILSVAKSKEVLLAATGGWRQRKQGLDEIYAEGAKLTRRHGTDFAAATTALKGWFKSLPLDAPAKRHKHYSTIDSRGVYFPDNISWPGGGGPKYDLPHPVTGRPVAIPSRGFLYQPDRMAELVADDRVHFGQDESAVPAFKAYLKDREYEVPYSVFYRDGRGATKRLRELLDSSVFQNPKDENILASIFEFAATKDSLVMDFFAGSGTTAHAVMKLNAEDGGTRRFVLMQLPEATHNPEYPTISDITRERVRRAGKKVKEESGDKAANLDTGFRAFRLSESNFRNWDSETDTFLSEELDFFVDNINVGAPDADVVHEILLKAGIPLDTDLQKIQIAGQDVYLAMEGLFAVSANRKITQDFIDGLLALEPWPSQVVLLDAGFGENDSLKLNARHQFASRRSDTDPDKDNALRTV